MYIGNLPSHCSAVFIICFFVSLLLLSASSKGKLPIYFNVTDHLVNNIKAIFIYWVIVISSYPPIISPFINISYLPCISVKKSIILRGVLSFVAFGQYLFIVVFYSCFFNLA